jgi:hypothetical protein
VERNKSEINLWMFEQWLQISSHTYTISKTHLTLILLTWRIWWAHNNASKWQIGFNSAFEGLNIMSVYFCLSGPGSSVGIATELRAGRSGIESRWGRDFPPVQTGPGVHPASCKTGTESFPGVKCGRGVLLTTHPLLVPRSWKSRAIPLPTLWATPGL